MKILYSLPHPADRLGTNGAGHLVRAASMLAALEALGHEVIRIEAADRAGAGASVGAYRKIVQRVLPRRFARMLRDLGRIEYGKAYGERLTRAVKQHAPHVILETHIAFSLGGKIASQQTNVPLVLDDCAPAWEEEQQYGVGLKRRALAIYQEVTTQARLLIAVNGSMHALLVEQGFAPEKVITIPNGLDPANFSSDIDPQTRREQHHISRDKAVIVFVGSFQPFHRVDLLLRAFQQMPERGNARLLLVGAGQASEECAALARELGIAGEVIFTGSVAYRQVASYIAAGDIAALPATSDYANPMKLYEYMALGKAIVAPRQPNVTEFATDGKDALLFQPGDVRALAAALSQLVADAALRGRLGAAAKELASGQTWECRALVLQAALTRLLENVESPSTN